MSPRQPDYEALRAQQARSQRADRIGTKTEDVCGETFDHDEVTILEDEDGIHWECLNCGTEGWGDSK